jgi:alpha-beta hydrolase superfamily lysophospholipase
MEMIKAVFFWLTGMAAVLVLSGCGSMVFYPDQKVYATPSDFNLTYREAVFPSLDGTRLSGWWIEPEARPKGTVLVAHGNAQNISAHFSLFDWLVRAGYEVFIFDYRGYGKSQGEPDLEGSVRDTRAALGYVLGEREGAIMVIGQSLGAVLLMNALSRSGTGRISLAVFDSAFASLPQAGQDTLSRSFLTWPFQWSAYLALTDAYDPIELVATLEVPKLFLAGSKDRVVSPNHSWQLFDASSQPRAFWLVTGAGHIGALNHPVVQRRFLAFLHRPDFDADASAMLIFDTITP